MKKNIYFRSLFALFLFFSIGFIIPGIKTEAAETPTTEVTIDETFSSMEEMEEAVAEKVRASFKENFTKNVSGFTNIIHVKVKTDSDPTGDKVLTVYDSLPNKVNKVIEKHVYKDAYSGRFMASNSLFANMKIATEKYNDGIWYGTITNTRIFTNLTYKKRVKFIDKATSLLKSLDLENKSDFEKIRDIYRWIITNIQYNNNAQNDGVLIYSAYGALVDRKAVCDGFSELLYFLGNESDVDTLSDAGKNAIGSAHSWNLTEIDGAYYYLDSSAEDAYENDDVSSDVMWFFLTSECPGKHVTTLNISDIEDKISDTNYKNWGAEGSDVPYFYRTTCDGNHTWKSEGTVAATCTKDGYYRKVCTKCGLVDRSSVTSEKALGHDPVAESTEREATCTESGGLYYICSRCGETVKIENEVEATGHSKEIRNKVAATCTQAGYTGDTYCATCGKLLDEGEDIDIQDHTESTINAKEATCTEDGYTGDKVCSVCNASLESGSVIPAKGHDWYVNKRKSKSATCTADGYNYYGCQDCDETKTETVPATGHSFTSGKFTFNSDGTATFTGTCSTCGTVKEKVEATEKVTKAAACTEVGTKTITVEAYGYSDSKTEDIPATGHQNTEIRNKKEASCKEDGYTGDTYCTDCGTLITKGKTVAAGEHSYDSGKITTAATCTKAGVKTYTCTACGTTKTETIPATGHSYDSGKVTKEATCTADGVKTYTCSACGATKTETISATGHQNTEIKNKKEATCKEEGYTGDTYCSDCKKTIETGKKIAKTDHSYDSGKVTKKATCTADGVKTYTCSVCGTTKTEKISATGHTGGTATCVNKAVCETCGKEYGNVDGDNHVNTEVVGKVDATCSTTGYTGDTYCNDCGKIIVKGKEVSKLAHSWDNGKVTKEATADEEGIKTYTCKNCGETKNEAIAKRKKTPKASSITLAGLSKNIAAGKKIQLTATISPANADKKVTWSSSNTKIATVSQTGLVTFKKGTGGKTVIITATVNDGSGLKTAYKIKAMKGLVKKVTIKGKKTVKAGKTLKLKATVKCSKGANKKLKWTSSNTKYATVTSTGKVKAKKTGKGKKVKITAIATDGSGKKAAVTIKIK